jgi:hypothetical protein
MAFYAKIATRSSGSASKGTPGQAMDYLQDDHDSKRETNMDSEEISYIARMDPGWKTEQEGGQIPLRGYGRAEGLPGDQTKAQFEYDCIPHYQKANGGQQPTTGYISITLTVPKEVSLYSEGHKPEAKEALLSAVKETLEKAYPGKEVSAVAAVHTRNENSEVHYHVHLLVAKFAKDQQTGKTISLNSSTGGNDQKIPDRLREAWTRGVTKEYEQSLGVQIHQRKDGKAVITLKDGSTLEPLNRNSRRALEREIAPTLEKTRGDGSTYKTSLKLNAMDQRIYEVSAQDQGRQGWNRKAFEGAFPKEAKHLDRYEKRVETLKEVGYLNREGRITQPFKEHVALKWGQETPQLQQVRSELHREARKGAVKEGCPIEPKMVSQAVLEKPDIKDRVERLGVSDASIQRFDQQRDMGTARVTPEQRSVAQLEKDLQRLPKERKEALRGAQGVDQVASIRSTFDSREADLRSRLESLRGTPTKSPEVPGDAPSRAPNGAAHGASQAVQKALPNEAQEGSKEARQALSVATSLRGGFRAVSQFMPQEARGVITKIHSAARLLNLAAGLMKEVKASIPKEKVSELKAGLKAGLARQDPTAHTIRSWRGKEGALATRTVTQANGRPTLSTRTFEAAKTVGQQGARLAMAEKPGPTLKLSSAQEPYRGAMDTLNRRFEAYGLKAPFAGDALKGVSPANLGQILQVGKGGSGLPGLSGGKGGPEPNVLKDLLQFAGKGTGWASASPASVASIHTVVLQALVKVLEKATELHKTLGAG